MQLQFSINKSTWTLSGANKEDFFRSCERGGGGSIRVVVNVVANNINSLSNRDVSKEGFYV